MKCSIKEGKIKTDLYRKETDRNQYLLPSSSHPKQTFKAIPRSLGMRIIRICSDPIDRDNRLQELKDSLLARSYPLAVIDSAIERVKKITREKALKRVYRPNQSERPVLVLPYNPRLPPVQSIIAKHWRSMGSQDSYLKSVFKEPPLTVYKRNKNLRSYLIRAKLANK